MNLINNDWENEDTLKSIFSDVASSHSAYAKIEKETSKLFETMA